MSSREISAMPLDRRLRFCGTAGAEGWTEEPRKNLITLSATVAIHYCARTNYVLRLGRRSLSSFSLDINFPAERSAFFNRNSLRGDVAI